MTIPSPPPIEEVPAAHLAGRRLERGWRVLDQIPKNPGATGGHFSISYNVVHDDGRQAFLKALNFLAALHGPGPLIQRLGEFVKAYEFELNLLQACNEKRLSRVIHLLDHGQISIPEAGPLSEVPYLILEAADGDIRAFQERSATFDSAWVIRTLNHATLGIEQLHSVHTAHQDLKPSNVLTQESGREMKLGDLGRAERRALDGPWSSADIPGAVAYAPPEQLYGGFGRTWEERRAGDVYLLGSLAFQLFVGHNLTAALQMRLPDPFRVQKWGGDFPSVIPYLTTAHAEVMSDLRERVEETITMPREVGELMNAITEMTAIDPALRGHPQDRKAHTSSYDVRRYVSLFNRIAKILEYRLRKV